MQKCTQEICSKSSFQPADSVILCLTIILKSFQFIYHQLYPLSRLLSTDIIFVEEEEGSVANDGCMLRSSHQQSSRGPHHPLLFPVLCFSPTVMLSSSLNHRTNTCLTLIHLQQRCCGSIKTEMKELVKILV